MKTKNWLYPVILPVPEKPLKPRARTKLLSQMARQALAISAQKNKMYFPVLPKDERGAPLAVNGQFWSLTHKQKFVAGVAASAPIGIDLEQIRPYSPGLFKKTITPAEWELAEGDPHDFFFRCWTARETILKVSGEGLRHFSRCRIVHVPDENHLVVCYQECDWLVQHFRFAGHIASIFKNDCQIKWLI